ncbi:TPR repeat containing protein [Acetobacter estunensis NRIC 0472]|uniref:Tetratricopeptide repeat protein n=1 Tax=Acetobacter estunensis TaxID=104097 RepID=A0A967B7V9_9PROT|nr:tetratricopeptide repeat protein [Acetobacter estunensis]NHO54478.1 tetratricopeptide repeat protein [Acetobacter estunensis]GBQ21926.1 TPR repeat containing protein [Acetobacter estunensis NRIC 0472]
MPSRPVLPVLLLASLLSSTALAAGHAAPTTTGKTATTTHLPEVPFPVDAPAFLTGLLAARADDYTTAARAYTDALKTDPNNTELLRQAFSQAALAGSPEAVDLARRTARLPGGRTIITAFVLGNDAVLHERWQDAAEAYRSVPADALTRILAPLLQAWCLTGEKKYDDALRLLTSPPSTSSPASPFYLGHAGLIASLAGKSQLAGQFYERANTLLQGGDLLLVRARANWLWQSGHQTEARDLMRNAIRRDPVLSLAEPEMQATLDTAPVASAKDGVAHAYILVAYILRQQALHASDTNGMQQMNIASAMMLRMALTLDPSLAVARLMLSEIEDSMDHPDVAIATLRVVPPTDPLARVARFRLALLEDRAGDRNDARTILEGLAHDAPDLVLPIRALGTLLFETKDYTGAITAFDKAIANARASHALDWSLLFERAAAYERTGNWPKAEADIQEARKMVPDEPIVLNFLGYGWVQRGQHLKDATQLLEHALELDPEDAAIRDSLGWAFIRSGDLKRGTDLLEHAAEETPLDPEVNYHLGVAYWNLGRHTEAIDQWNVALGLKPEPDDLARINTALDFAKTAGPEAKLSIQDVPTTP